MLEIVREELGIASADPAKGAAPSKIAREFHARIAGVLERREPRTFELTCAIARHYFAAGALYASQSLDACQAAARACLKKGARADARRYLAMASLSARLAHRTLDVADERALIENEESARTAQAVPDKNGAVGAP
jgi:hypothetical protein